MPGANLGPDYDLAKRLSQLEQRVGELSNRDVLANSSIGQGGLTVNGGSITITMGGSLIVSGGGSISVPSGALTTAGSITAGYLTVGSAAPSTFAGNVTVAGNVTAGSLTSTGGIQSTSGAASNFAGDVFIPGMTPVVTAYVAMYRNSDGRLGLSVSAARFKRDFEPVGVDEYARAVLRAPIVRFRIAAAVDEVGDEAPVEPGLIADYLQRIGLGEYVFTDENGQPLGIHYERLTVPLIATVQSLDVRLRALEER
jgi:hypothetical protein